jgi:trigger factor
MSESVLAMDVSVERLSDVERKIDVDIPWDQVRGRLDEAYKDLGQGVQVKGFRRGKVPRKMLERLFGKHVNQEVSQRLVQDSIGKALTDNDLAPVSEPKVEDGVIADGEAFKYSATLQVVPEIEPKDYMGIDVGVRKAAVTDEGVDEALTKKQQELTDFKAVEGRNTQTGDLLTVDILGKVGGKPVDFEGEVIELGADRERFAGLAEKLTDIPAAEAELDVTLELPIHDHAPGEPCGADEKTETAQLLVTVTGIRERIVPELDDDFAQDTGEAETLAELRDVYRKNLLEADEQQAKDEAKETLVAELLKVNDVPAVPALVERHLERMAQLQMHFMGMQGADPEEVKDHLRADAEKTVRRSMILSAIGKKEEVEVHDADLEKKLAEIAGYRQQSVPRTRSEYEKEGRMDALRTNILEEKTLDLLMSKANLSEVEASEVEANEEAEQA